MCCVRSTVNSMRAHAHTHTRTHTHTHTYTLALSLFLSLFLSLSLSHTHTQVDVTFDLDANGILTVTAQDQVTKAKADIKITQVAILKSQRASVTYILYTRAFSYHTARYSHRIYYIRAL